MKGTSDRHANVTITFNSQGEILEAPAAADGSRRKYLPCDCCGSVDAVPLNVVGGLCDPCDTAIDNDFHKQDEHCAFADGVDAKTGDCGICGVSGGVICDACGGERFHRPGCPDETSEGVPAASNPPEPLETSSPTLTITVCQRCGEQTGVPERHEIYCSQTEK